MSAAVAQATNWAMFMRAPSSITARTRMPGTFVEACKRMSGWRPSGFGLTTMPSDYGRHFATMKVIAHLQCSLSRHDAQVHAAQFTGGLGLRVLRDCSEILNPFSQMRMPCCPGQHGA